MKREIGMTNTHQSPTYTFKGKNKKEHMLTHKGSARNKVCGLRILRVVPNDRTVIRHADGSKEAEKDSLFTGLSLQFGCKGHVMSDVQFGIWYIYIYGICYQDWWDFYTMEKPLLHVMVYGIYIFMGFIYHLYIIYIQFIYHLYTMYIPFDYHLYTIYIPFIYHLYTMSYCNTGVSRKVGNVEEPWGFSPLFDDKETGFFHNIL